MTDVKRLLDEATPLPWHTRDRGIGWEVHTGNAELGCQSDQPNWCPTITDGYRDTMSEGDAALVVHAVNRLPDYEAAVAALADMILNFDSAQYSQNRSQKRAWERATVALSHLRDEGPA